MKGYVRVSAIVGVVSLVVCLGLAFIGLAWAAGCVLPVAALAGGYMGGSAEKDDPSKTARNTRRGALAGLVIVLFGLAGRLVAGLVSPQAAQINLLSDGCLAALSVVVGLVLGGIGGWAYVRQQHEKQTGYKPT
ncbi:MAG: hypothetical protein HZB53_05830 [Chloroflexi bacterium]|nr:hypothetical protein [Chloroflexota bacterium]